MLWFFWMLVGVVLGAGCAIVAARWQVRRSQKKAGAAERRARAAERLAEIGAMTGGLAHEIKNPLSTIGLNAQLLAEAVEELPTDRPIEPESKQRISRRLSSLRREVERLRGILTDFLNYAGELRLDLQEADINRVVDELADFFLPQAGQHGVRLRTQLEESELRCRVDVGLIKQAVLNLLLNAVQAIVSAPASEGRPRELILRTHRSAAEGEPAVVLHVIDTGPGIPADVLPKVFTPYFTTKTGGTGLGLPTTRRIIEAHHGRIDVHSDAEHGTDFVVTLPESRPEIAPPAP